MNRQFFKLGLYHENPDLFLDSEQDGDFGTKSSFKEELDKPNVYQDKPARSAEFIKKVNATMAKIYPNEGFKELSPDHPLSGTAKQLFQSNFVVCEVGCSSLDEDLLVLLGGSANEEAQSKPPPAFLPPVEADPADPAEPAEPAELRDGEPAEGEIAADGSGPEGENEFPSAEENQMPDYLRQANKKTALAIHSLQQEKTLVLRELDTVEIQSLFFSPDKKLLFLVSRRAIAVFGVADCQRIAQVEFAQASDAGGVFDKDLKGAVDSTQEPTLECDVLLFHRFFDPSLKMQPFSEGPLPEVAFEYSSPKLLVFGDCNHIYVLRLAGLANPEPRLEPLSRLCIDKYCVESEASEAVYMHVPHDLSRIIIVRSSSAGPDSKLRISALKIESDFFQDFDGESSPNYSFIDIDKKLACHVMQVDRSPPPAFAKSMLFVDAKKLTVEEIDFREIYSVSRKTHCRLRSPVLSDFRSFCCRRILLALDSRACVVDLYVRSPRGDYSLGASVELPFKCIVLSARLAGGRLFFIAPQFSFSVRTELLSSTRAQDVRSSGEARFGHSAQYLEVLDLLVDFGPQSLHLWRPDTGFQAIDCAGPLNAFSHSFKGRGSFVIRELFVNGAIRNKVWIRAQLKMENSESFKFVGLVAELDLESLAFTVVNQPNEVLITMDHTAATFIDPKKPSGIRVLNLADGGSVMLAEANPTHTAIKAKDKVFVFHSIFTYPFCSFEVYYSDTGFRFSVGVLPKVSTGIGVYRTNPNGKKLLLHCRGVLHLIDTESLEVKTHLIRPDKIDNKMTLFSPDSKYLVQASYKKNKFYIYDSLSFNIAFQDRLGLEEQNPLGYQLFLFTSDSKSLLVNNTQEGLISVYSMANFKLVTNVSVPKNLICIRFWLTEKETQLTMLCSKRRPPEKFASFWVNMPFCMSGANDWLLTRTSIEKYYTESNEIDRINTAQSLHTLWNSLLPHVAQQNSVLCTMLYLFDNQKLFDSCFASGIFELENMLSHHRLIELAFEVPCKQSTRSLIKALEDYHLANKKNPYIDCTGIPNLILSKRRHMLPDDLTRHLLHKLLFAKLPHRMVGKLKDPKSCVVPFSREAEEAEVQTLTETTSPLFLEVTSSYEEYSFCQSKFEIDLTNGSAFSRAFFDVVNSMNDVDLKGPLKLIINYKWSLVYRSAVIYSALLWSVSVLAYLFLGFMRQSLGLLVPICILNSLLILFELKALCTDFKEYVRRAGNWVDIIVQFMCFGVCVAAYLTREKQATATVQALAWVRGLTILILFYRSIKWMKVFAPMRYLVRIVLKVFGEIMPFLAILVALVLVYSFVWKLVDMLDGNLKTELGFYLSAINSVNIVFGNGPDPSESSPVYSVVKFLVNIYGNGLLNLILLNYLIALIAGTFSTVSGDKDLFDSKELIKIIRDFDTFYARGATNNKVFPAGQMPRGSRMLFVIDPTFVEDTEMPVVMRKLEQVEESVQRFARKSENVEVFIEEAFQELRDEIEKINPQNNGDEDWSEEDED